VTQRGNVPIEVVRVWTEGNALGVELAVPDAVRNELRSMGHEVLAVPTVAGGMNAIQFHDDGRLTGAACWRADGTPIGVAGGLARSGVRFGLARPARDPEPRDVTQTLSRFDLSY
jgi:gamma-glutamyltranspeptidase/glutathione hydrolase